ncbi:MAG: 1,6-anhydro-N-acetylmuramyl-L-alanine amidase AmpD [Pseudomonadales bacterium]
MSPHSSTNCNSDNLPGKHRIVDGWLADAQRIPSPNFNVRPQNTPISMLVIHNISLPPGEFGGGYIDALFCNCLEPHAHDFFAQIAQLEVSAHLLIDRQGAVTQYVNFADRAWHAGQSCYAGVDNCNDYSIGIELEGTDSCPYTDQQYARLQQVTWLLMNTYSHLNGERIVGHCDIAPGRKTDPGPSFDWARYRLSLEKLTGGSQ